MLINCLLPIRLLINSSYVFGGSKVIDEFLTNPALFKVNCVCVCVFGYAGTSLNSMTKCSSFHKDFIYLFLERGEGREKERETNINMCGRLSHAPYWGPGPQPRPMP